MVKIISPEVEESEREKVDSVVEAVDETPAIGDKVGEAPAVGDNIEEGSTGEKEEGMHVEGVIEVVTSELGLGSL